MNGGGGTQSAIWTSIDQPNRQNKRVRLIRTYMENAKSDMGNRIVNRGKEQINEEDGHEKSG